MRCMQIIEKLEKLAPLSYACEWDNPGFLAGRGDKEVSKILLALDATDEVVAQAKEEQADMLLTHHPLIFRPLYKVNDTDFISRRIVRLLQSDIAYYAMHTNYDTAPGCMADLAAERIGLTGCRPLEVTGTAVMDGMETEIGIGKVGSLRRSCTLMELAEQIKTEFGLPFVSVYGLEHITGAVEVCAVSPGSGESMISHALSAGAQVLITGDIGHHKGIDAVANHMAVIDAGHYGLEHIFMEHMTMWFRQQFGDALQVVTARPAWPVTVVE